MNSSHSQAYTFICPIVGFGCLHVIFIACFFPLTLMPAADESAYRFFNQALYLSSATAALFYALAAARCDRKTIVRITVFGYIALAVGLIATGWDTANHSQPLLAIAGIGCGAGLSIALISWFETIGSFSERKAVLILGWQAFFGSAFFAIVALLNKALTNEVALALSLISGVLFLFLHNVTPRSDSGSAPSSFRSGIEALRQQKVFSRVLIVPAVGFFLIVFIFGIAESIALGYDGSPYGEAASYLGAPIGSLIFLIWTYASKKRDYGMSIKSIFLILLAVFWIPTFDIIVLVLSTGFQLSLLLLCSLLLDQLSSQHRVSVFLISLGYVCMRLLFLTGLYVPRMFGVTSYSSYFESTSLLMFIIYLIFAVMLFLNWGSRVSQNSRYECGEVSYTDIAADVPSAEMRELPETEVVLRVARKHGLTRRETEILSLYSKGRDINYVCGSLHLSRNTVKGHMKSIYVKLAIHSKQELIDIVEAEQGRGEAP